VVDVIAAQSETAVRRIAGIPRRDEVFASPLMSMAIRTPWLALGLAAAAITAFIVRRFETTIAEVAVLAALMPIVASMSGAAAMQTVTLTIRSLARGRITSDNAWAVIRRELSIAMLSGLVLGVTVLVVIGLWLDHWGIGAAAGMALFLGFVAAGSIGILVPLTLHRLQIDPAPAAGLITTSTDAIGYGLLLVLGTLVLLW
jgi:magnesium transporter